MTGGHRVLQTPFLVFIIIIYFYRTISLHFDLDKYCLRRHMVQDFGILVRSTG